MAGSEGFGLNEAKMVVPLNTWILISNFKLAYTLQRRPDGTFNRHLAEFLDRKAPANAIPVDGVSSIDAVIDRATGLWCRTYVPVIDGADDGRSLPVIVYFHGGSFAHSSANSTIYDAFCRRLGGICKAVVVSVNYRRSPEYRFPMPYDDGWAALRWVTSPFARPWLGKASDPSRQLYLAGDSSGGNIVHHVAQRAGQNGVSIAGNILLAPMFGGQRRTPSELKLDGKYFVTVRDRDWYWKAFLPDGADRDHPACNPFGPRGFDLRTICFPKSLVVVADLDLVHDWQLNYVDGLRAAGKDVKLLYLEQTTIGFYLLPNTSHFYRLMDEIKRFLAVAEDDKVGD